jgi:hypothetical protein
VKGQFNKHKKSKNGNSGNKKFHKTIKKLKLKVTPADGNK